MNYIVNPLTNIKYSIFSKNGIKLLKSYVKFYQTGGSTPELTKRTCSECKKGYEHTLKLNDSNINKCISAQTTFDFCTTCIRSKMNTKQYKTDENEKNKIEELFDKAEEMKEYTMKQKCRDARRSRSSSRKEAKEEEEDEEYSPPSITVSQSEMPLPLPAISTDVEEEGGGTKDDGSLTIKPCETGWKIITTENIGASSQNAKVYDTCCEEDCTYASKIIGNKMTPAEIQKEIEIHKAIYERDKSLTIPILDVFKKNNQIILVLPKLRITVGNLLETELMEDLPNPVLKTNFEEYVDKLYDILGKLHEAGFQHGDAHLNNFMINKENEIILIDFGKSKQLSQEEQKNEDYEDLYESLRHLIIYTTLDEKNDKKEKLLMNIINLKFKKELAIDSE